MNREHGKGCRSDSTLRRGRLIAGAAAVAMICTPVALIASGGTSGGTTSPRTATSTCDNNKTTNPDGCWTPPAGYIPAPAGEPFTPIAVTPYSGISIPPGTITNQTQPPFSASDYVINDSWWNTKNGVNVGVFAGNSGGDSSQGVVVVVSGPPGSIPGSPGYSITAFPTVAKNGTLSIVSSNGWILTLDANDGTKYYFSASTDMFVSAGTN